MISLIMQLPTWALALLVPVTGYLIYIVSVMIMRTLIELAEVAMGAASYFIDVGSTALAGMVTRMFGVIVSLIFIGLRAMFRPAGTAFDRFTEWLTFKLADRPQPNAEEHRQWVDSVQDRVKEAREILGLSLGFSNADLQQAHRKIMNQIHPDKGGSEWMAKRANEARDLLKRVHGW